MRLTLSTGEQIELGLRYVDHTTPSGRETKATQIWMRFPGFLPGLQSSDVKDKKDEHHTWDIEVNAVPHVNDRFSRAEGRKAARQKFAKEFAKHRDLLIKQDRKLIWMSLCPELFSYHEVREVEQKQLSVDQSKVRARMESVIDYMKNTESTTDDNKADVEVAKRQPADVAVLMK